MLFDESFIDWAQENPSEGLIKACETAFERLEELRGMPNGLEEAQELLLDASS
jgi:hypothetical protein